MAADKDNSNEISYEELLSECGKIHCAYVLDQMREVIEDSGIDLKKVFDTYDRDKSNSVEINEFNEIIS